MVVVHLKMAMDAVWSPGSYGHWVPYLQYQNTSLDYTIYENNPSSDLRSVDLDFDANS